jgi:abequosyltransferase
MRADDILVKIIQPLLTIAIPTYNRATYLDLCLSRVSEELDSLSADQRKLVGVYVSNNASTDNTSQVISQYRFMEAGAFEVVHNEKNIGGEGNVAQCYTFASTPYVWIIGDDDVILPGGLRKVLDVLLPQDIDVLYVNNYWFTDNYTERPRSFEIHGILVCKTSVDFARRTNVMLTFISGLIVRSGIGFENISGVVNNSNLPQLGWVLPLLRDGKCFVVIEDAVIAAKGSNSGGYGLVKVFGNNLVNITDEILKDKPDVARAIQNGTIVNFFPGFVLELRKGNSKFSDKDIAVGLQEAFGGNWRYYVFLLPLILLPLPLARIYNVLLKVFRRLFRSVVV